MKMSLMLKYLKYSAIIMAEVAMLYGFIDVVLIPVVKGIMAFFERIREHNSLWRIIKIGLAVGWIISMLY